MLCKHMLCMYACTWKRRDQVRLNYDRTGSKHLWSSASICYACMRTWKRIGQVRPNCDRTQPLWRRHFLLFVVCSCSLIIPVIHKLKAFVMLGKHMLYMYACTWKRRGQVRLNYDRTGSKHLWCSASICYACMRVPESVEAKCGSTTTRHKLCDEVMF